LEKDYKFQDTELNSRVARLDLDIEKIDAKECIIYLASNHRYNSFIKINFKKKTLKFSRRFSGLIKDAVDERKIDVDIKSGKLSLSILLDRFSVEIFVNGGKEVLSSRIYTPAEANEISFIADGEVRVDACKRDIVE
jgi:sucrose-6-phosphate hydrolase